MDTARERVISITLTAEEWQTFVARQPKPVDWLRQRILDEVAAARRDDGAQTQFTQKN
jgi:hypothetical protein